ncbi:hypothetical protein [Actinomadura sp. BRA 177]|uniref:hypothetical protein n=1 Tax=Actinomadura sp. BRA 177 TaxID=2745202 RepID=UPI001595657D|nr:hypothetical protein [Actinomadura sp. BRA 177]NVI88528.1 hypothetical protein [Actinomadura sp. BRA 177]
MDPGAGAGGRVPDGVERGVEGRADVIVLVCEGLLEAAGGGADQGSIDEQCEGAFEGRAVFFG